jgi:hypothetical protein
MIAEACGLREIEDEIVRLVVGGGDLLQDHVALAFQLFIVEFGRGEDVGQNVEGQRPVVLQHAGIIGGGFHAGCGIDLAAGRFDFLGDGARRTAGRALEGHMLEEMGDAVFIRALIARPGLDPDAKSHRLQMRHVVGHHSDAIGETGDLYTHTLLFRQATGATGCARAPLLHHWAAL